MKFKIKQTILTDGSTVFDFDLFPNGEESFTERPMCIFSCTCESGAREFSKGLADLVDRLTCETLEDVSV